MTLQHLVVGAPVNLTVNTPFRVSTTHLAAMPAPYSSSPDTVAYLLQCDDQACNSGNVLVADDDGNNANWQFASKAEIEHVPSTGWYRYIVTSYMMGNEGRAEISVTTSNGTSTFTAFFGGLHIVPQEVRPGDSLLVGKNNNTDAGASPPIGMPGNPEYHDTMMVMFSNYACNCTSNCGRFLFNDDAWILNSTRNFLSRIVVSAADQTDWSLSRIIVGSYLDNNANNQPMMINVRAMHYRRHTQQNGQWTCDAQRDDDGDGLSQEIEAAVGSCDALADGPIGGVAVVGINCYGFATIVNSKVNAIQLYNSCPLIPSVNEGGQDCWHAKDSDNDGIRDDWEVFAGAAYWNTPAVGPTYDPGSCVAYAPGNGVCTPYSIHDSNTNCVGHTFCSTLDVSAKSDPHPGVYDIFVRNDYFQCSGSNCVGDYLGASVSHAITDAQGQLLPPLWTADPLSCWDGTPFPCANPIDTTVNLPYNTKDLPYRVKMHAYSGPSPAAGLPLLFPDTKVEQAGTGLEGAGGSSPWFNKTFSGGERYLAIFHYAIASFYGGGNSLGGINRTTIWGNRIGNPNDVIATFSHEIGHQLSLKHPHDSLPFPNSGQAGKCVAAECTTPGDCQCSSPCVGATCALQYAKYNDSNNPAGASLMSYDWTGMLAKSPNIPNGTGNCFAACSKLNLRFSKGLNDALVESALAEQIPNGPKARKLAQDLWCYDEIGDCTACSPFGVVGFNGPFCAGPSCNVDWNKDALLSANPVAYDVSRGQYQQTGQCTGDTLTDIDEWRSIIARGKQALRVSSFPDFTLFATPFNGSRTSIFNHAGWGPDIPITYTANIIDPTLEVADFERNICTAATASQCGSGACSFDTCAPNLPAPQCKTSGCTAGACSCTKDADCRSHWCDLTTQKCNTTRGACVCLLDPSLCVATANEPSSCTPQGYCATQRTPEIAPPGDPWKPRESAQFGGSANPQFIKLGNIGATSPLTTIGTGGVVRIQFAFRWLGGAGTQMLFNSSSFNVSLTVSSSGASATLNASAAGVPLAEVTNGIAPHQWYVVQFAARPQRLWLTVSPYNMLTASYDLLQTCSFHDQSIILNTPNDIWIGTAADGTSQAFNGRMDNINIFSYIGYDGPPSGCTSK